jgi:hypothetical protein
MRTSKILTIDEYNETSTNKNAIFSINRTDSFLDPGKEYQMGILRFYIPMSLISPISQTTNYTVGIGHKTLNNRELASTYSVANSSTNMNTFIDSLNYSVSRSLYSFYKAQALESVNSLVQVSTGSFVNSFTNASRSDKNFTISSSYTSGRVAFMKITLTKFKVKIGYDAQVENVGFSIKSPDGTECQIISNKTPYLANDTTTKNIEIADYNAESQQGPLVDGSSIRPIELFMKFSSKNPVGNWAVHCELGNMLDEVEISFNYEIVWLNDTEYYQTNFACCPPFFSIDGSDNVSLNYSEAFIKSGFYLLLNNSLNSILNFENENVTIESIQYKSVKLSSYIGTGNTPSQLNVLTVKQDTSSNSKTINDLYKLIIRTTLDVESSIIGSDSKLTDTTLTDFLLDQYDNKFYTFSADYPNRLFKLLENGRANRFQISIWIKRKNGAEELLTYAPGENVNLLLAFYEINQ